MMDYGSLVPLKRAGDHGPALFPCSQPVGYIRLWKSQDSEPFLFPYSEMPLDLSKATPMETAPTQVYSPGLRVKTTGASGGTTPGVGGVGGVDPKAKTQVGPSHAPLGSKQESIDPAHPKPEHLRSEPHQLAHAKGVLYGASSKLAEMDRKMTEGGPGISDQEAQDYSKLSGLKDRMVHVSGAMERMGIKDMPQHHQELQQHWQDNPGARSGAVGGTLHLDAATMHAAHGSLGSAQPGPTPAKVPSGLKPISSVGPRGRVPGPGGDPGPTPTTSGGSLTPLPAVGGGASRAELELSPSLSGPGTGADSPAALDPGKQRRIGASPAAQHRTVDPSLAQIPHAYPPSPQLQRALLLITDMLKAFEPGPAGVHPHIDDEALVGHHLSQARWHHSRGQDEAGRMHTLAAGGSVSRQAANQATAEATKRTWSKDTAVAPITNGKKKKKAEELAASLAAFKGIFPEAAAPKLEAGKIPSRTPPEGTHPLKYHPSVIGRLTDMLQKEKDPVRRKQIDREIGHHFSQTLGVSPYDAPKKKSMSKSLQIVDAMLSML